MLGVCSLFIPASEPRMINASLSLQADTLIFDLEDAVHMDEKDSARILLLHALPIFQGRNAAVRINSVDTIWRDDLEVFRTGLVQTVVVPKANPESVKRVSEALNEMHSDADIAALIESAESLEQLNDIIKASNRMTSLLLGGEDYSLDLGVERTRRGEEIFYARVRIVTAAAANQLEAIDTPFSDAKDTEGLIIDTKYAKSLGFTGKLAINPLQVAPIQTTFYPSELELNWAEMVIRATNLQENQGKGAFSLHGKMIDLPIIRRAEKTIARAEKRGGTVC